jgi:hypothetical protein
MSVIKPVIYRNDLLGDFLNALFLRPPYREPKQPCYLEVVAPGWPLEIGPFQSEVHAERWLRNRFIDGEWRVMPLSDPSRFNHLGRGGKER